MTREERERDKAERRAAALRANLKRRKAGAVDEPASPRDGDHPRAPR